MTTKIYNEIAINLIPQAIKLIEPLIKKDEGFERLLPNGLVTAYLDPVKIPTIGWGTVWYSNGAKVKMGDVITVAQCQFELEHMLAKKASELIKHITFPINVNQLASMLSFSYNAGVGSPTDPKKRGTVNKQFFKVFATTGDTLKAASFLEKTALTGQGSNKILAGLVNRRKKEAELFRAPVNGSNTIIVEKKKPINIIYNASKSIVDNYREFFGF